MKKIDKDSSGWTPVHYAVQTGDVNKLQELIKQDHDLNVSVNIGVQTHQVVTPLILAVMGGHVEMIPLLINNGAPVNWRVTMTAFEAATQHKTKAPELMKVLVENGAKAIDGNFKPHIIYVHWEKLNIQPQFKNQVVATILKYAFDHNDNQSIESYKTDNRVLEFDKSEEFLSKIFNPEEEVIKVITENHENNNLLVEELGKLSLNEEDN